MERERRKVLEMTQQGILSVDEANELLNVLRWGENTAVSSTSSVLQITSTDWPSLQRTLQILTALMA